MNLLAHFVGGAVGKHGLRFRAAAPEDDPPAESLLEFDGIHVRGGRLDGVQNIDARLDEILHDVDVRAATVIHRLRVAVLMDVVGHQLDVGDVEFLEDPRAEEFALLRAEIGAGHENRVDVFSDRLQDSRVRFSTARSAVACKMENA